MQYVTKEHQLLCFIETFLNSSRFTSTHESYCQPAALAFPQGLVPVAGAALQELPQHTEGLEGVSGDAWCHGYTSASGVSLQKICCQAPACSQIQAPRPLPAASCSL